MLAWLADGMRGAVRSAFPLATLGVLAGLLSSPQCKDVLVTLIEDAATRHSVGGFVFLGFAAAALSLSVWYSMRWLLTAHMPGLPLSPNVGFWRKALPRLAGLAAPALVAASLASLAVTAKYERVESLAVASFYGLAAALGLFFVLRSRLLKWLERRGWLSDTAGRAANGRPSALAPGEPTPPATLRVIAWSVVGTFLVGLLVTLFPVTLPRVVGGAAVAALALASINLFGSFVLTYWPLRHGLPNLAPWVLAVAGVFGFWNDNHTVEPAPSPVDAPDVNLAADFDDFLARGEFERYRAASEPVPVVFVASEGGGIRAAYWTAAVLSRLDRQLPGFESHVYAVSGVSGGSLGLAAWLTAMRSARCSRPVGGAPTVPEPASVTAPLAMDFVSPAIAGIFYYDLAQRFIPKPIERFDRSRAMEEGWRRAFEGATDRPFEQTLAAFYSGCGQGLPHLLLNSTRVETGERVVLSRLPPDALTPRPDTPPGECPQKAAQAAAAAGSSQETAIAAPPRGVFTATFDGMDPAFGARTQSLAGLVHHSARFPVVSPAGTVRRTKPGRPCDLAAFRLVDGGYFDNSGVQTTLELIGTLRERSQVPFRPVLLIVRNDASEEIAQQSSGPFPETSSVLGTLLAVRGAHAVLARETANRQVADRITLRVTGNSGAALAPLGWALSQAVRDAMDADADGVAKRGAEALEPVLRAPGGG